jgi:hypothetical protein
MMYRIYLRNWNQFNIYEIIHEIKNDGGYYKHNNDGNDLYPGRRWSRDLLKSSRFLISNPRWGQ